MLIEEVTIEGYHLDLGDECYSLEVSGASVQIRTLTQVKVKGGMRDCFIPPEGYVWISCDYCLDPESVVITTRGQLKLNELVEGDLVYTPWGYKPCKNIRYTGKKRVVKIKLKTGEVLRCSTEHLVCVKRDGEVCWVKAGNLKSSDYIFSKNNINYLYNHGINPGDIREVGE